MHTSVPICLCSTLPAKLMVFLHLFATQAEVKGQIKKGVSLDPLVTFYYSKKSNEGKYKH